jgi:transcriptional regulator with XRE-family HTH domain
MKPASRSSFPKYCAIRPADRCRHRRGIAAGTILRCTRRSAGISQTELADAMGINEEVVRAWEEGSTPLASVPLPRVTALEASLRRAGASADMVADLAAACWCDLIFAAIAEHQDITTLLADPITRETAFGELLAWCIAGCVPERYKPYADLRPLR